jgi:tRNA pseudouridine38-40 synthase
VAVVKLLLAYDGTGFRGWARQPRVRTVQGVLEKALTTVLRVTPLLSAAGRTDAGVHARGQVVSFAVDGPVTLSRLQGSLNGMLGPEVVVVAARFAPDGFDARRSATAREYRYRIDTGPVPDPFTARFVWHRPGELSMGRMRSGARFLVGRHDFGSFCRAPEAGGTVRDLHRLAVSRRGSRLEVLARANAYCHQMVRSLVGTLVSLGEARLDPEAISAILDANDRSAAGPVAPPHGLTLERVVYGRRSPGRGPP